MGNSGKNNGLQFSDRFSELLRLWASRSSPAVENLSVDRLVSLMEDYLAEQTGKVKQPVSPLKRWDHEEIERIITPGSRVLDLGCGNGELLHALVGSKNVCGQGIELAAGANHDIFTPTIYSASCFEVTGQACSDCFVEIFTGNDEEGKIFEGSTQASQLQPFFSWTGMLHGNNVTVTQMNYQGDTSEFSIVVTHACYHIFLPLIVH